MIEVKAAGPGDITELVPLLDAYRVFYEQASDPTACHNFLKKRFETEDSIIFIAYKEGEAVGFTQLYPSFSTVSLQRLYILNDLFVTPESRGLGVATALLENAKEYCVRQGAKGLALETAEDNPARALYERNDWKHYPEWIHYFWTVS